MERNDKSISKTLLLVMFMMFVFSMSFISALEYKDHKQNTDLYFSITSNNATQCTLTSINTPTVIRTINQVGTKSSQTFNFTVLAGNLSELGLHEMNIECTDGVTTSTGQIGREIKTQIDNIKTQDNFPFYIAIVLAVCFFAYIKISRFLGTMGIFVTGFGVLFRESTMGYIGWTIISIGFLGMLYAVFSEPKKRIIRKRF